MSHYVYTIQMYMYAFYNSHVSYYVEEMFKIQNLVTKIAKRLNIYETEKRIT